MDFAFDLFPVSIGRGYIYGCFNFAYAIFVFKRIRVRKKGKTRIFDA